MNTINFILILLLIIGITSVIGETDVLIKNPTKRTMKAIHTSISHNMESKIARIVQEDGDKDKSDKLKESFFLTDPVSLCPEDSCTTLYFTTSTNSTLFTLTKSTNSEEKELTITRIEDFSTKGKKPTQTTYNVALPEWADESAMFTLTTLKKDKHPFLYIILKEEGTFTTYKLYRIPKVLTTKGTNDQPTAMQLVMDLNHEKMTITSNLAINDKQGGLYFMAEIDSKPVLYRVDLDTSEYTLQLTYLSPSDPLIVDSFFTEIVVDQTNSSVIIAGRYINPESSTIHYPVLVYFDTIKVQYSLLKIDLPDNTILGMAVDELLYPGTVYTLVAPPQSAGVQDIKLLRVDVVNGSIPTTTIFHDVGLDILFGMKYVYAAANGTQNPAFSSLIFSYSAHDSRRNALRLQEYQITEDGYIQASIVENLSGNVSKVSLNTFTDSSRTHISLVARIANSQTTTLYGLHVMPDLIPEPFRLPDWAIILTVSIIVAIEYIVIIGCTFGSHLLKRIKNRGKKENIEEKVEYGNDEEYNKI